MCRYLGIDVGGTFIKYGVYDNECVEIYSNKIPTNKDTLDEFVDSLASIIEEHSYVEGIGISLPGFVDAKTGLIVQPGAIMPLKNQNLRKLLLEKCGREVCIENDANCVALAEKWTGNGMNYSDFIAITFGTGVGGGIIIDNKLYRGKAFMAGEFGYMIVDGKCNTEYSESTSSVISSTISLVKEVANVKGIDFKILSGEQVFDMIMREDEKVIHIYEKWIERVSLTIYNLVYSLGPEAVLIGGGISSQKKVLHDIKEKINEIQANTTDIVKIDTCRFANDSGKIGAVYHYLTSKEKIIEVV